MNDHLQRALIEVYYAIADFNQGCATPPLAEQADACAQLAVIRTILEKLLLTDQVTELKLVA